MSQYEVKRKGFSDVLIEIILVGLFFAYMGFHVLPDHVPSSDPTMIYVWSLGTAACMSGVFWLALWMFLVVLRYQGVLKKRQ